MTYNIEYDLDLNKTLLKVPRRDAKAIKEAIQELAKNPRPIGVVKLSGIEGYRVRVGNYRISYQIFDNKLIVLILNVAGRKEVYKKK